jgi:phage FluMu gp28-like protein
MPDGDIISKEDWARLREEARQSFPAHLAGGNLPDALISYQQELLATTAANELTVVEKSRRTGITFGAASDAVLTSAAQKAAGGMDTFYIGYNLDMAREFIDTSAMWAKAFSQAASTVDEFMFQDVDKDGNSKEIQAFRIHFASGFEICALSSRPRSLRGRQGYVIIDEAAFHDDLDGLIKAALALLMWGGKVLVISTHDGDLNPFNILVQDIKSGRRPGAIMTLDFDEALRQGLYQRICLVTGKDWSPEAEAEWRDKIIAFYGDGANEELFVIPSSGSGTYLPATLIERQQRDGIPVVRWECGKDFLQLSQGLRELEAKNFCAKELLPLLDAADPKLMSFIGTDFAMTGDLSIDWPIQMQQNMVRRPLFVLELRRVPYAQQKDILWYIIKRLPRFVKAAMDATGNGAPLAQETALEFGLNIIEQVKINEAWYREITPRFKAGFEDGLTVLPRDVDVYNDHRSIKIVRGVAQVQRQSAVKAAKGEDAAEGKAGGKRHGDSAIGHMMAYWASLLPFAEFGYESVIPQRHDAAKQHSDAYDDHMAHQGDFGRGNARFGGGAF